MSLKRIALFLSLAALVLLSAFGCQSDPNSPKRSTSEDDLIARLSVELVGNPRTQAEKERNQIINYAIDSLLDVQSTPSGLYYYIEEPGTGNPPPRGGRVTAHYRGRMLDGKEFDSSYRRGQPLSFGLGQMIPAWQEGIPMLRPGGKATFLVPSALAYGTRGFPGLIDPNTPLRFDVELLTVN
ncbi:MAG: FKBP-type peptidyl-prolyl cis-trans isomerase [Bacteroidota bacterium]